MHVVGKVVIGESLNFLSRTEALLHVDFEGTTQLSLIDLSYVARVLQLVQLHILEVVLLLEVFVKSVHHFDAAVEELDAMALLVNVELVELVAILIRILLRVKQFE